MKTEQFAGLEAGINDVFRSQIKGASNTPPLIGEAHDTLQQANAIAARIMDLADRLCGPRDEAGSDSAITGSGGELGRLRADMRDTRQAMIYADEALSRIARELIG